MKIEELSLDYEKINPLAIRLQGALVNELIHLLAKNNVTLGVPLESRVKTWSSIEEKLQRKAIKINSVTDISDFIGIRLILLFRNDLDIVNELLVKNLAIVSSEDTGERLNESQFGYQSNHYVVKIPSTWQNLPSYADFGDLKVEIQVRTLAQHIWAAASHKLQYKHEESVPKPLRRSIYRASALLETIDLEFDRILAERGNYVQHAVPSTQPHDLLNVELVKSILKDLLPPENMGKDEPYDDLLTDLNHFGLNTVVALRSMITSHLSKIMKEEEKYRLRESRPYYFKHVGLAREGLRAQFGNAVVQDFLVSKFSLKTKKHRKKLLPPQE
jgi:putative GTP pyrophosphokinase